MSEQADQTPGERERQDPWAPPAERTVPDTGDSDSGAGRPEPESGARTLSGSEVETSSEVATAGVSGAEAETVGVSGSEAETVGASGSEAETVGVSGREAEAAAGSVPATGPEAETIGATPPGPHDGG
ncbi:hypothetical protein ABT367_35550, partial [Streptomyces mesophilus]